MSGTVVLDQNDGGQQNQQQQQAKPPAVALVDEPQHTGPTAEEALAASRKAIETAEAASRASQQREQAAQAELHRVRASQQQDQAAVLASAVEASSAEHDRHAHSWQAAMEAGDFEAARKHQSAMMMSAAKLERAQGELAVVKAGAQQRQQQQGGGQPQQAVSNASQNWINSKPAFNKHRDALLLKHQELVNDGIVPESPRYFRELDTEYDRLANNGQQHEGGTGEMNKGGQGRQFDGAPPSRGGAGGSQGGTVRTLLGPISVRQVGGQTMIQIPQNLRESFNEGAKVNNMSVEEYAMEHVRIAREMDAGGNGGLISEEGKIYR